MLTEAQFRKAYTDAYAEHGDWTPTERDILVSWQSYQKNPAGHFISGRQWEPLEPHSKPLPPDPERLNLHRSAWAEQAINRFRYVTGSDEDTALTDLLTDLMHWCDRKGKYFNVELFRARDVYREETKET